MTTPEENKAIFRHVWESWYKGDQTALRKYYAPNLIDHEAGPGEPTDLEGLILRVSVFSNAFSYSRWTVVDQIAEEDFVTTRWTLRQKHTGELMGIPPTGKEVVFTGTSTVRFANGEVVERWSNTHLLSLLRQLDAMPRTPKPGNVGRKSEARMTEAPNDSERQHSSKDSLLKGGVIAGDSSQERKEIFRRVWDDYYNKGNKSTVFNYYDTNVVDHEARPGEAPGLVGLLQNVERISESKDAFSETRWSVDFQVAEGDVVASHWTFRRKHTGNFLGIPPTGKEVTFSGT